ncbi:hypothetical protein LCGC14_2055420, partial [marine sediment metagenome]
MANFTGTTLFVVDDAGSLTVPDGNLKDRLETNGWTVTSKSDDDVFLDTDSNWETFNVAVVAESSSSVTLGTSGRDAVVGVIMLEGGSVDDWDLATSPAAGRDTTAIEVHTNDEVAGGIAGSGTAHEITITTLTKDLRGLTDESSGAVAVANNSASASEEVLVRWELGATLTTGTAADRRVWIGWFREDLPDPPNEGVVGFVVDDTGYAIFDSSVEWAAGNDIETDRQLGVTVADLVTTNWTKVSTNYFEDVDDGKVPDSATTAVSSPNNPPNSPISFDLTSLTDPSNNMLHTVAIGHRREAGARTLTILIELRQGYVNESTLGTLIATSGVLNVDAQQDWGGKILQLTTTEADNITDYTDLQIRIVANVSGGGSTTRLAITSIRLLIDGGAAAGQIIAVGVLAEVNSLISVAAEKPIIQAVGVLAETNPLIPTVAVKEAPIGVLGEANSLISVGPIKVAPVGTLGEANTLVPVAADKPIITAVGTIPEVDALNAIPPVKVAPIGTLAEIDSLIAVLARKTADIGTIVESNVLITVVAE